MGLFSKGKNSDEGVSAGFSCTMTPEQWQKRLSPEAYRVLRERGTEYAGSSPLNDEKRNGTYRCAGCGQPLFSAQAKYDSGSGWPSFFQPLNESALGTSIDHVLAIPRVEVHCAGCGGHLGHMFDDGPRPTGKRYCMNGVALRFEPSLEGKGG